MRIATIVGVAGTLGFGLVWLRRILAGPYPNDFLLYRIAAQIGLANGWSHIYDIDRQRPLFESLNPAGSVFLPFWSPPPLAWVAVPFTLLSAGQGYWLWVALVAAGWILAWRLLAPGDGRERAVHLLLLTALFPVVFGLYLGQPIAWQAASVAGGWWLLRRNRDLAAGALLGLVVIKPNTLLLLPLFLLVGGRPKATLGWVLSGGALAVLSLVNLGPAGVTGALGSLRQAVDFTNPDYILVGVFGSGLALWLARAVMIAVALGVALRWRSEGPEMPMAAAVFVSLATAQYLHLQDLGLVIVGCWLALRGDGGWQQRAFQFLIYLGAMASLGTGRLLLTAEMVWLLAMLPGPRGWPSRSAASAGWSKKENVGSPEQSSGDAGR